MTMTARREATFLASFCEVDSGCWIWNKTLQRNGYGRFSVSENKQRLAHRLSYEMFCGEIPGGLNVCHTCDTRACVNPSHLFLGSQKDNIQDAKRKGRLRGGRRRRGEDNPAAKLRSSDVVAIRQSCASGMSRAECARHYNVSWNLISLIVQGKAWKHVEGACA
jgi:hypothetical protein